MKKTLIAFTVFILLNITNNFCAPQSLQDIQVEFIRYYKEKNTEEIIKGTIYFSSQENITVLIKEPINQWMILGKFVMDIYYPDQRKAFRFNTQNPVTLPFFQAFLGVVNKDYGLIDLGYSLSYHRKKGGDTLLTYWSPPKKASRILGDFTLVYVSGKISYAEFKKPNGSTLSKSHYSNHIQYGEYYFPLEIFTVRYSKADSTVEKITYINPQFNVELPEEVVGFKIPQDVIIEEIEW
ncbi:hypothetical protein KAU34_10010 [candidate division WOR-3 bacterium]|nr:hypothetical protein [candidate division WOR-3 bacterium]